MSCSENSAVTRAREVLQGRHLSADELIPLAESLLDQRSFGLARKLFGRIRELPEVRQSPLRLRMAQRHALATYRDPDLPVDSRLERALEILAEADDLASTTNQETLGLAGAVYKRKWEADNQKLHLERALTYYRRGYDVGVEHDHGYTGINAAFILDLLAHQESVEATKAGAESVGAQARRDEADAIRSRIIEVLEQIASTSEHASLLKEWWFLVTLGEAWFGLQQYDKALPYLKQASELPDVAEWKRESTARQLASLAHRQQTGTPSTSSLSAWDALDAFLGHDLAALKSARRDKIGLALSGGGFRASLFHIGILAKLAELDVLREVEVLSCVSGGSIIGAHYYLEVRSLLQRKRDDEITREDYIDLVHRMERDFLAGVQRNIRMRVLSEWTTNLKMIFRRNYSRTMRAGELYEEEIYSRIGDGEQNAERYLSGLTIQPAGEEGDFSPRVQNWRRKNKVPILIINATTLNTGHNWQFTATWMGEPPGAIDSTIDGNYRFRRMYYRDAPAGFHHVRLGHAVAASACVPGLFEPLALDGIYDGRVVRLVDGGVHDNQGATGLLEQGCRVVLVSDASGQIDALDHPGSGSLGVLLRSTEIFQARMREAAYHDLAARRRSSLLKGLLFVHLKKDLDVDPIDWNGCPDPYASSDNALPLARRGPLTTYGINKEVQRHLAALRTDLDSFTDREAFALMTSGYRMAENDIPKCLPDVVAAQHSRVPWRFLQLEPELSQVPADASLTTQLTVGSERFLKVWRLNRPLRVASMMIGAGLLILLATSWKEWWPLPLISVTVGGVATLALMAAAGRIFGSATMRVVHYRKTLRDVLIGAGMAVGGFLLAKIHLWLFDPLFLKMGSVQPAKTTLEVELPSSPPQSPVSTGSPPAKDLRPS